MTEPKPRSSVSDLLMTTRSMLGRYDRAPFEAAGEPVDGVLEKSDAWCPPTLQPMMAFVHHA